MSPQPCHNMQPFKSLAWQMPVEKGGAGCPTNKGYSLGNSIYPSTTNSVSSYSTPGGGVVESCPEIKCKHCPWKASDSEVSAIQAGTITECPKLWKKTIIKHMKQNQDCEICYKNYLQRLWVGG